MPLTPEQVDLLQAHLREVGKDSTCPVCKSKSWALEGPFALLPIQGTGIHLGSGAAPMALVVCTRCFYSRMFALGPIEAKRRG